ncbi:MAG: patatin-like phospholipase family protein [Calditrichaeota bacterium]|nr:patatin-like phospholipase family protein [Calditrichota bacterium]
MKIGLALGGGAARGLAHIGVLQVLEREGIPIHVIVGCSIGAVIGGVYAQTRSVEAVKEVAYQMLKSEAVEKMGLDFMGEEGFRLPEDAGLEDIFNYLKLHFSLIKVFNKPYFFDPELVDALFAPISTARIERFPIKFAAVATDLIAAEEVLIQKGPLRDAVRASSAIPGVFPPFEKDDRLLVDGSSTNTVPAQEVRDLGADVVIAVDVSKDIHRIGKLDNALNILYRVDEIASHLLTRQRLHAADVIIRPHVGNVVWADFDRIEELIQKGRDAAESRLPLIQQMLTAPAWSWKRRWQSVRRKLTGWIRST